MKKREVSKEQVLKTYDMVLIMSLAVSLFSSFYFIENLEASSLRFLICAVCSLLFLLVTLFLVKNEHKYTSIFGIISGIFLFFISNGVGIALGILMIYNSIRLEKYIK